jgi:hypothetical protein
MNLTFDECRIAEYDDSELISHIRSSPPISPDSALWIISPNLIAKLIEESEAADEVEGIRFAQQLKLPVPDIKRVIRKGRDVYMIMARIRGRTMEDAWPKMSWFSTIWIALQLRRYVGVMRSRHSPTAGALITGKCNSIWLEDYYGLPEHATPAILSSFIQFWLQYEPRRKRMNGTRINSRKPHVLPTTLDYFVFTHQDLAPRNLFLDEHNNLWILDWERSGWYPIYFEYAGMQNSNLHLVGWGDKLRWWLFCLISVGIYGDERRVLSVVREKCMRNPIARKNIVLEEGANIDAFHLRKRGI